MRALNECGVFCLIVLYLLNGAADADSCKQLGKPTNQILQVCHEKTLITDKVYIDSSGAPDEDDITCSCTVESMDTSPRNITVRSPSTKSYWYYFSHRVYFKIKEHTFSNYMDSSTREEHIQINNVTNITFRRPYENSWTTLCLSLLAGCDGTEIRVQCWKNAGTVIVKTDKTGSSSTKGDGAAIFGGVLAAAVFAVIIVAIVVSMANKRGSASNRPIETPC